MSKIIVNPRFDALIAIDVQPTFMPGGGLAVPDGDAIVPVGRMLMDNWPNMMMRFATQDFHPHGHISFASSYVGLKPFTPLTKREVDTWPDGTLIAPTARFTFAELRDYLAALPDGFQTLWPDHGMQTEPETRIHSRFHHAEFKHILRKGMDHACDSYGAFEDNLMRPTGFADILRACGVKRCFFWGLALDYCVRFSAEGAARNSFEAYVIEDATRPVTAAGALDARRAFTVAGIKVVDSDDLELNVLMRGGG